MKEIPGVFGGWKQAGLVRCLAFLLLCCGNVVGQSGEIGATQTAGQRANPPFINFTNKEGLSANSVNAICKDRYGYMWFATEDGLNKFDGSNFIVYRQNTSDSATIGGNDILSLLQDRRGRLWVGTNQSLSLYNADKEVFTNYHFMGNSAIRALCEDHTGAIWAGGYSGLYRLDPVSGKIDKYRPGPGRKHVLSNTILSLFEDSRHRLWVGTNAGLDLYVRERDEFQPYVHVKTDSNSIADSIVRAITEDARGDLWFATNNGLSRLRQDGKGFTNYTKTPNDPGSLSCNHLYALETDKMDRLWIGTEEGLDIFEPGSGRSQRVVRDARNKYSLVGNSVRSLYIDTGGLYWIGTYQGGISKYDENLAFFNFRGSNPFDPAGLSSPIVTSFAEAPSGDIYVGTDGGGLNLYHRKSGLFSHPVLEKGRDGGRLSILCMTRRRDELWVGTYHQGIYVLDTRSGGLRHMTQNGSPDGLSGNDIFCLRADSKGNMWIGTNGNGVDLCPAGSAIIRHPGQTATGPGAGILNIGFIRDIEEDEKGKIWIASSGAGIIWYDPGSRLTRVLDHDASNLPSNVALSLLRDRNGRMWTGTKGGGLSLYDPGTGKFLSFSEPEGLSNAVIYKILEDSAGKLWLSTNKGISSFDPVSHRFKNYSYRNGLQRSTFALGAGVATRAGDLFFGGMDGFNYFEPRDLQNTKRVPSLQLTALKIANRTVIPGPDEPIREHISDAREIRLDFKQNFSIDFIALNYIAPEECRYAYKLDGFDRDWNNVGSSHTAIYTNLDPGEYTFRAKATSDDGAWTTPERSIRIVVKPPFWRTAYAYASYVLLAILLIVLLRYMGVRRLKNKFALEQERSRTRQLIEQERQEAERQHEFDELKIRFLTNLSHEFRTPVSLIVGPVERLLGEEKNGERMRQLSMVKRNANRLLNLVNQLLDFRKLEEHELNLNLTEADLVSFVRDVAESFRDIAGAKQIDFAFTASIARYPTRFDRDKIERILLNLLSNAFKFTPREGKIRLGLENGPEPGVVKITVADSGIGMSPEVREKIFTRFFQARENTDVLNQGSGIGLSIAREFVRLHGGAIEVESELGRGSTFTVLLPCAPITEESMSVADEVMPVAEDPGPVMEAGRPVAGMGVADQEASEFVQAGSEGVTGTAPAQPARMFRNITVLLIEDDDDFRQYLSESLKPFYRIVEAANGKEGWQRVLSAHPQVVVSDINMPYMDGITLSRKMGSDKRTRHIPIILLTAITGDANRLMGLQTGASDYLTKPFNFEILNQKINNLISFNERIRNTYTRQLKVIPGSEDIGTASDDEKLLGRITEYIDSHIDSPDLSVEDLSRHLYMSRGSLYNKIVELTGETPVEFIRSIKLTKAAMYLERSDMKIAQIGYAVGFSSPNYFAKAFKAKFNLSPSEYARQKRGFESSENAEAHSG